MEKKEEKWKQDYRRDKREKERKEKEEERKQKRDRFSPPVISVLRVYYRTRFTIEKLYYIYIYISDTYILYIYTYI